MPSAKYVPDLVTDRRFESGRALRGHFKQKGSQRTPYGEIRPATARLREFERVAYQDTVVYAALTYLSKSIVSTIGSITHPDAEIQTFLEYNLQRLEDERGSSWHRIFQDIIFSTFVNGFSVTEKLFTLNDQGQLVLDNLVTYHPSSILIRPDKNGMLNEKKMDYSGYAKSGIYQNPTNLNPEVQLPLWKILYLTHNSTFGNYYGKSVIGPLYKWHKLKEALVDMMASALDRFGNPLLYVSMPSYQTDQVETDPSTGEERPLTTLEVLERQIGNLQSNGNVIFLPQMDATNKPQIGTLTTGNNVGQTFLDAIQYCNEQMVLSIGIPYFLISAELKSGEGTVERRMENYYSQLEAYRQHLLAPICKQVFSHLVAYNFSRESAKVPPQFSRVHSDRPEDRVATMQVISGLTKHGYFNPRNQMDYEMVRQMVRAGTREQTRDDVKFVDEVLLNQRQIDATAKMADKAHEFQAEEADKKREFDAEQAREDRKVQRAQAKENAAARAKAAAAAPKSAPNAKGGRPTGSSSPQNTSRPKTSTRPKGSTQ